MLVAEDNPELSALWIDVFEASGHRPLAASSPEAARRALLTDRFDLVLLDLHFGRESGLPLATLAGYANPDCKVVVVTGSSLFARGELFSVAPNISAVLRKPVDIQELVAVCEHHAEPRLPVSA